MFPDAMIQISLLVFLPLKFLMKIHSTRVMLLDCPAGWINLGGLCYKNPVDCNTLVTRSQAAQLCANIGGWLPSFSNLNEWQSVVDYV